MLTANARRVLGLAAAVSCVLTCAGTTTPIAFARDGHGHDDTHAAPKAEPKKAPPVAAAPEKHSSTHGEPTAATTRSADKDARPATKKNTVAPESDTPKTADDALRLLQDGNARWVSGSVTDPNTDTARRAKLASEGQKPFVTVLTCADSRLPVERMFDRGVGDVFVVRVAGAVAGGSETGTIEYGVGHLKTPLLVVMGHTKCGAVAAAASGAELHGKVAELVGVIAPAVERVKRNNPGVDEKQIASLAVRENVWQSIFDLYKWSSEMRAAVTNGDVKVVGAVCDIATGKVEWLGEHPWQNELIDAMNARQNSKGHETATGHASDQPE